MSFREISLRFPRSILELGRIFSTEKKCLKYMFQIRWPDGFICPYCGGEKPYWIKSRKTFSCAACKKQISLKVGTVMEKSKTPLSVWFTGAYFMTTFKPGISAMEFQHQMNIPSYECAFQVLHKLRSAAGQHEDDKLSGEIEVDETFVGAERKGLAGRSAKGKSLIVGAVEIRGRAAGRARLRKITKASGRELQRFLRRHVEPGTQVNTDGWRGYASIHKLGFYHDVVVSSKIQSEVEEWLPHVHRVFGNLKVWLNGTHHGVSPKHIQAYLNEFTFRFNRRKNRKEAFNELLGLAAHRQGPTYEKLYRSGKRRGWKHPNPSEAEFEVA